MLCERVLFLSFFEVFLKSLIFLLLFEQFLDRLVLLFDLQILLLLSQQKLNECDYHTKLVKLIYLKHLLLYQLFLCLKYP